MSETLQYEITLPSHGVRENKNYPVVIALHRATDSIEKVAVYILNQ